MIARAVIALVIAIVVWLVLVYLLGPILITLVFPVAVILGDFFIHWGVVLAICAFLWYFFFGYKSWHPLG